MQRLTALAWDSPGPAGSLVRTGLAPVSVVLDLVTQARAAAYRRRYLPTRRLPLPSVSVGNLSVGGTGKTPLASWIAGWFWRRGIRPGILLRGYGGDESGIHRQSVAGAVVVEDRDRLRGGNTAAELGAEVLVLDDGFQRLDVARDLDLVLIGAESRPGRRHTLPAGPWRERPGALRRADFAVVTRKCADDATVREVEQWLARHLRPGCPVAVAELTIDAFEGLWSAICYPRDTVRGMKVVAAAGIASPGNFVKQLEALGARVDAAAFTDHHRYSAGDVRQVLRRATGADLVAMTGKDAVKLRRLWPRNEPEPLVARLDVRWTRGLDLLEEALNRLHQPGGESREGS